MEGNVYPLIDYFNSRGHELDSSNTEALNHVWEGSIEVFKSGPMFHPKKCLSLDALLLGDPDSQEVFLPSAREEVAGIASQLLGHRESSISVGPLDLMLHAHTKPIRAGIRIDSADNNIEGKIYLKIFDPTRVFGIQLYNLLAGIGVDYHFVTDDELTVEEEVGGNHLFDLEDSKRSSLNRSPLFTSQRIALDSYRINLGFGDLVKEDNFVVSEGGMIRVIDFDILIHPTYHEIERIKSKTTEGMGVFRAFYDSVFEEQTKLILLNYQKNKREVDLLLNAYASFDSFCKSQAQTIFGFLNSKRKVLNTS